MDKHSIALSVAFTGIAAKLLQGGRTFNSRFKYPLKADDSATCFVSRQSGLAKLIRKSKIIVWDEAPMSHKCLLEALDRLLRDLMEENTPFGNKIIVLSGDFRQLFIVIQGEACSQIINASFKKSILWKHFKTLKLTENMRIKQ